MPQQAQPNSRHLVARYQHPVHIEQGSAVTFQPNDIVERVHCQCKTDTDGWVHLTWGGATSKIRIWSGAWLTLEILGRYQYETETFEIFNESALNVVVEWIRLK